MEGLNTNIFTAPLNAAHPLIITSSAEICRFCAFLPPSTLEDIRSVFDRLIGEVNLSIYHNDLSGKFHLINGLIDGQNGACNDVEIDFLGEGFFDFLDGPVLSAPLASAVPVPTKKKADMDTSSEGGGASKSKKRRAVDDEGNGARSDEASGATADERERETDKVKAKKRIKLNPDQRRERNATAQRKRYQNRTQEQKILDRERKAASKRARETQKQRAIKAAADKARETQKQRAKTAAKHAIGKRAEIQKEIELVGSDQLSRVYKAYIEAVAKGNVVECIIILKMEIYVRIALRIGVSHLISDEELFLSRRYSSDGKEKALGKKGLIAPERARREVRNELLEYVKEKRETRAAEKLRLRKQSLEYKVKARKIIEIAKAKVKARKVIEIAKAKAKKASADKAKRIKAKARKALQRPRDGRQGAKAAKSLYDKERYARAKAAREVKLTPDQKKAKAVRATLVAKAYQRKWYLKYKEEIAAEAAKLTGSK